MDSTIDCDYKIIVIDSSVSKFVNNGLCEFYIDLDEPLRNVYKIKIITILANIYNSSVKLNNDLESIYIDLNNYNRLISKKLGTQINTYKTKEGDNIVTRISEVEKYFNLYYFDSLIIESKNPSDTGYTTIKNDYNNADIEYFINPIEPQLNKFTIRLFDKTNNLLNTSSDIKRFIMKLGIYYNNRKTTRL